MCASLEWIIGAFWHGRQCSAFASVVVCVSPAIRENGILRISGRDVLADAFAIIFRSQLGGEKRQITMRADNNNVPNWVYASNEKKGIPYRII